MRRKEKILEKAQKYLQKGAYEKALAEYRSLKEVDPGDVTVRLRLGDLLVQLGMNEEAVNEYTAVAKAHARRGFYLKAIAVYKRILKLEGSNTDTHYKLAELYTKQRLIADAMSQYTIILSAFEQKGMDNEALDLLRKMVDLDPSNQSIRLRLADLFRKLGYTEDALSLYSEICSKLIEAGNTKKAEEICLELRKVYPDEPGALRVLMDVYRSLGDQEKFTELGAMLLRSFIRSGELEEASRVSREILDVSPGHEESLSFLESYEPGDMLEFEPGEGAAIEEEAERASDEAPGAPMPEVEVVPGHEAGASPEGGEEPLSGGAGIEAGAATEGAGPLAGDSDEEPAAGAGELEDGGEEDEEIEIDLEGFDDLAGAEAASGWPGEEGAAGAEVEKTEETAPPGEAGSLAGQDLGAGAEDIPEEEGVDGRVEEESAPGPDDDEEYVEIEIPGLDDEAQTRPPDEASEEGVEEAADAQEPNEPGEGAGPVGSTGEAGGQGETLEEDLLEEIEPLEEPGELETPSSPLGSPPDDGAPVANEEETSGDLSEEAPMSEGEEPAGQDPLYAPEGPGEEEGASYAQECLSCEGAAEQGGSEAPPEQYLAPGPGPEEEDTETGTLPVETGLPEVYGVEEAGAVEASPGEEREEGAWPLESDAEGRVDRDQADRSAGEPTEEGPSEGAATADDVQAASCEPMSMEEDQEEGGLPLEEPRPEETPEAPLEDEAYAASDEGAEAKEGPVVAATGNSSLDEAATPPSADEGPLFGPPLSEESAAEGPYVEEPLVERPSDEGAACEEDLEMEAEPLHDLADGEAGAGGGHAAEAVDEEPPAAFQEAYSEAETPGKGHGDEEEIGDARGEEAAGSASFDDLGEAGPPDLESEPPGEVPGFEEGQPVDGPGHFHGDDLREEIAVTAEGPVDEPAQDFPGAEEVLSQEEVLSVEEAGRPEEEQASQEAASPEEAPSVDEARTLEEPSSGEEMPFIEEAPSTEEPLHEAPDLDEAPPDEREPIDTGLDEAAGNIEEGPTVEISDDDEMPDEGEALGEGEPLLGGPSPGVAAPEESGPETREGDEARGEDADGVLEKVDAFLEMDVEEVEEAAGPEEGAQTTEETASGEDASHEGPPSEETAPEEGQAEVAGEGTEGSVPGMEYEESSLAGMAGAGGDAGEGHDEEGPVTDDAAEPVTGERPVEETLAEAAQRGAHEEDAAPEGPSGSGLEDVEVASEPPEAMEEPVGDSALEVQEIGPQAEDTDQLSEAEEEEARGDFLVAIPETIYDQRPDEEPSCHDLREQVPGGAEAADTEAAHAGVTDESIEEEPSEEGPFGHGEQGAPAPEGAEEGSTSCAGVEHRADGVLEAGEGLSDEGSVEPIEEEPSEDDGVEVEGIDEGHPEEEGAEEEEPLREETPPEQAWDEEPWDEEAFAAEQVGENLPQPGTPGAEEGMGASGLLRSEEEREEEPVATAGEEHVEDPYDHWEWGPSHEHGEESADADEAAEAEALRDFIYTEPELEEAIQNLARSSTAGDVFETYEEIKTGLENQLSTEDAGTHFNLGREYLEMELYREAAREFKIALKDHALEVECYINLAHCALAEANHEEAIIYFLKVLKGFDGPEAERRGFLYDLATSYEASGQEAEAEGIYRSIYEVDPRFRNVAYKIKKASARERAIPLEDTMLEVELL